MSQPERSNKNTKQNERLQKWLLPAVIGLALIGLGSVFFLVTNQDHVEVDEAVYQFYFNERYEFREGTVITRKDDRITIEERGSEAVGGENTPVYYSNSLRLLLVSDTSWYDSITENEWRIPAFSVIEEDENGVIRCIIGKKSYVLPGGFLNDGNGTYVFLDRGTVEINGEMIAAEPFSFCTTSFGMIRLYDYGTKNLISEDSVNGNVKLHSKQGYLLDLTTGIYTGADGSMRLLVASPEYLHDVSKRPH